MKINGLGVIEVLANGSNNISDKPYQNNYKKVCSHANTNCIVQGVRLCQEVITWVCYILRIQCNAGNNGRSLNIVRPNNFGKCLVNFTLWLDTMTKHLNRTSWVTSFKVLSVNKNMSAQTCKNFMSEQKGDLKLHHSRCCQSMKICLLKCVKCLTKREIWKDIISYEWRKIISSTTLPPITAASCSLHFFTIRGYSALANGSQQLKNRKQQQQKKT